MGVCVMSQWYPCKHNWPVTHYSVWGQLTWIFCFSCIIYWLIDWLIVLFYRDYKTLNWKKQRSWSWLWSTSGKNPQTQKIMLVKFGNKCLHLKAMISFLDQMHIQHKESVSHHCSCSGLTELTFLWFNFISPLFSGEFVLHFFNVCLF